ncbi:hypothetical protein JHC09_07550 [Devosia sp. MC532]|uniref:hypothetical protein n=1 Tax=Devosia sp. MC532 TaxID=2799788 RepID=UPI0018F4A3DA|nr:hypothetical protein [Devosia sp. MC532]MBJ7577741.1 hypothetical protein [Devosia sp. MC532]
MRHIMTPFIAALLVSPALGDALQDQRAPDYSGPMLVDYRPVMCVRAPCPPGVYVIEGDGFTTRARTVIIEDAGAINQYNGQYLEVEDISGSIWLGADATGTPLPLDVVYIAITPETAPTP